MHADSDPSKYVLGVKYKEDIKQSIIEMGYSLIEKGVVKDLRNHPPDPI